MNTGSRISDFYVKHEYSFVLTFVLIWQVVLLFASNGLFVETDNYTHALRLMDMIQSGSWQEILYRHDNCPFGQMLHFTRITDMFLFLTTLPFRPFMDLKQAIVFGGFLYNPLMACLSAAGLIWVGRPFLTPMLRAATVLCYFILPFISILFLAGRPDHHVLLNLLLIILIGSLSYGAKTQKNAYYKLAGISAGLSVWATPEGFLTCIFLFAGMIAAWLCRYQNIRQIRFFGQFLFITTAVCWIVNPPMQGLFYPDNGRLSVLMVVVLGLSFVSFYTEEFLEKERYISSFIGRFCSLFFAAALSFVFVFFIFGKKALFSSPIPPEIFYIWAKDINELQPGYKGNLFESEVVIFLYVLMIAIVSFFSGSFRTKKLLITIGIPVFFFFILSLISARFSRPCSVFAVFLFLLSIHILIQNFQIPPKALTAGKMFFLFFFACLYTAKVNSNHQIQLDLNGRISLPDEYRSYISSTPGCIMALNDRGPEIAWGTGRSVIGSPYHSNVQGITDNYTILNTPDPIEAQKLLKKRYVTTILLDRPEHIPSRGKRKKIFDFLLDSHTFAGQLFSGKYDYCFLSFPEDMPETLKEKYLIYHVDFKKCGKKQAP
ncbi:MAG: hypothetical protein IJ846_05590 [Alphaproteobacteria bacterium]|nr:hypothetical protein [Alphaproteobacteria bacterium]